MNVSELIKQLQELMDEHGDLQVEIICGNNVSYTGAGKVSVHTYSLGSDFDYPVISIGP